MVVILYTFVLCRRDAVILPDLLDIGTTVYSHQWSLLAHRGVRCARLDRSS